MSIRTPRTQRLVLAAAAITASVAVGTAEVASAHTLSSSRAGARAWAEAKDAAEPGDWYGARGCSRQSRHMFTCIIWTWTNRNDTLWDAYVNVRFSSAYGYRTVGGRWYDQDYYHQDSRPSWRGRYIYEWMWVSGARNLRPAAP